MKKLRLDLDALEVESFATTPSDSNDAKGTVRGYGSQGGCRSINPAAGICEPDPTVFNASCNGSCVNTCGNTCYNTCGNSCNGTCGYTCGGTCNGSCNFCTFGIKECDESRHICP